MNPIIKDVEIGFNANHGISTVSAKQYDTNRKLRCQLVDDEISYIASDVNYLYLRERFSNGQILLPVELEDAEYSSDYSEVTFSLTKDMLMIPGTAYCELVFIKGTGTPEFDDKGHLINDDWTILSTQAFHLYIDPTVYEDDSSGEVAKEYQDILIQLVIVAQHIIDDFDQWEADEQTREANEAIRVQNESQRVTAENGRVSAEIVRERNSDKIEAEAFGGTYTDESSQTHTVTNDYIDPDGHTQTASLDDFEGMSIIAITAQSKDFAHHAVNAKHYADLAEAAMNAAEISATSAGNAATLAEGYKDTAESAAASATSSATSAGNYADEVEVMYEKINDDFTNLNDRLHIVVDNNGHLLWEIVAT